MDACKKYWPPLEVFTCRIMAQPFHRSCLWYSWTGFRGVVGDELQWKVQLYFILSIITFYRLVFTLGLFRLISVKIKEKNDSDICNEQFCLSDHVFWAGRWFDRKGNGVESNGQTSDQPMTNQLAKTMNWRGINGKCGHFPLRMLSWVSRFSII